MKTSSIHECETAETDAIRANVQPNRRRCWPARRRESPAERWRRLRKIFVKPGTCPRGRPSKKKLVRATNAWSGIEGFDADGAYRLEWNGMVLFFVPRVVTTRGYDDDDEDDEDED